MWYRCLPERKRSGSAEPLRKRNYLLPESLCLGILRISWAYCLFLFSAEEKPACGSSQRLFYKMYVSTAAKKQIFCENGQCLQKIHNLKKKMVAQKKALLYTKSVALCGGAAAPVGVNGMKRKVAALSAGNFRGQWSENRTNSQIHTAVLNFKKRHTRNSVFELL